MFRSMSYPQVFNAVSTANKVSLVSRVMGLFASARHTGAASPRQAATTNPRTQKPRIRLRKKRLRNPSRKTGHPTVLKKDRRRTPSVYGVRSRGSNEEGRQWAYFELILKKMVVIPSSKRSLSFRAQKNGCHSERLVSGARNLLFWPASENSQTFPLTSTARPSTV